MKGIKMSKARVIAFLMSALLPAAALGQSGQNGSIVGYVFDEGGMPLKGIKISATSPTQIGGAKVSYTNDEGAFRLPQLQPGDFEVRASAPKLETIVMKDVKVGISGAAEINVVMKVQTKTEEIAVVEKAPLVITTKSNITEVFDLEMVENLPHGSRDNIHSQVVNDVAGGMNGRIRGGAGRQTIFSQDGFEMRGQFPTLKSSAAYEINTGGFGVDNPMAAGGTINLVTKSGSNKFEFEFNAVADSNRLQFFRDEQDSPAPSYTYYINPMVSGPIIKDKLWFHFNTESHIIQEVRDPDVEGIFPTPDAYRKFIQKGTLKLTWQVSSRNKLQTLTNFDSPHEYNQRGTLGIAPEAERIRHGFRFMQGLIWESLLSDSLVLRSQVAYMIPISQHIYPRLCADQPVECRHTPAVRNSFPRATEYGNDRQETREEQYSVQFQNRVEWFLTSKTLGEHALQLKDNFYAEQDIRKFSRPGDKYYEYNGTIPDALTTYYSNDPRLEPERYGWYITRSTVARHIATLSDAWRPTRYLTVTPALSHVWATGGNSSGNTLVGAQAFAPSVAVAWDATHDGRTALRASYSNYVDINIFDLARHTLGGQVQKRCRWNSDRAAEGDAAFDRECEFTGGTRNTFGLPCGPLGIDANGNPCREKLGIPRVFEYTLGAEREVTQGVALAFDVVYKDFQNQYETRETNRIWNASGSTLSQTGGYRNGRRETVSDLGTPDGAARFYKGATIGLNKREGRMKARASYTLSQLEGNVFDGSDNQWGDIAPRDVFLWGPLADDHRHEIKFSSTYQFTPWLSTGMRYRYFSGRPYNHYYRNEVTGNWEVLRARTGINPGTNINDPTDDRELRLPDLQDFNVQVRLNLFPLLGERLDFYVDVLNALALRTPNNIGQEDGRDFGVIRGRQGPFRIRLGLNYRY
jgi:hypothetical protein